MGTGARNRARWLAISIVLSGACAEGTAFNESDLPLGEGLPDTGDIGSDDYDSSQDPSIADGNASSDGDAPPNGDDALGDEVGGDDELGDGDGSGVSVDAGGESTEGGAGSPGEDAGGGEADAGAEPIDPPPCAVGLTDCGSGCVDLSIADEHCGTCGNACGEGLTCRSGSCQPPAGCTVETFGDHAYLFCSAGAAWSDARTNCLGWGMDLAVVDDETEHLFIQGHGLHWIGLNDLHAEGAFAWVPTGDASTTKGQTPGFTAWVSGEPNNQETCTIPVILCTGVHEHCVELRDDGWNDEDCRDAQAYVCESH